MSTAAPPPSEQQYAGQRLGLPEHGPGSVASWGRRVAALFIDWFASLFVAAFVVRATGTDLAQANVNLLVFFLEVTLFTGIAGGSFGQLALRLAVVRLDGRPPSILKAALRTLLICLVIPPLVFNPDRRGLHDLAAGTITRNR